jgi:hypothetical protein
MSLVLAGHFPALAPVPAAAPYAKPGGGKPWRDAHYGPSVAVIGYVVSHGRYTFRLACGHDKPGNRSKRPRARCRVCR